MLLDASTSQTRRPQLHATAAPEASSIQLLWQCCSDRAQPPLSSSIFASAAHAVTFVPFHCSPDAPALRQEPWQLYLHVRHILNLRHINSPWQCCCSSAWSLLFFTSSPSLAACTVRHLPSLLLDAICTSRSACVSRSPSAAEALLWPYCGCNREAQQTPAQSSTAHALYAAARTFHVSEQQT